MSNFTLISATGVASDFLDDLHIVVQKIQGLGIPTPTNVSVSYAIMDGQVPQRQVYPVREITLTCKFVGASLADWHARRRIVEAQVNRDVTSDWEPMYLQYSGAGVTYQVPVYYAGGLEINNQRVFQEFFPLKFVSYDPFWQVTTTSTATLATIGTLSDARCIVQRQPDGTWAALGGGVNNVVSAIAIDPASGAVYVGGSFTVAYNGPGTTNPVTVNRIAKWDPVTEQWSALNVASGSPGLNGDVLCLSIRPNGTVVVGGTFSMWSVNNLLMYLPETDEFAICGGLGTDGAVYCAGFDTAGRLYIGGVFTHVYDGDATPHAYAYGAKTADGTTWTALGSGPGGYVYALSRGRDDLMYFGGAFAGVFASYDGTTWTALGSDVDDSAFGLSVGPDGMLYYGGFFTQIYGSACLRAAVYNGVTFYPLGGGVGPATNDHVTYVRSLLVLDDGTLLAGGNFTSAEGIALSDRVALWTGSMWVPLDINLPSTPAVIALAQAADGTLYIGFNTIGTASVPGSTDVLNEGSARAFPVITLTCSGVNATDTATIQSVANGATGDEIFINYTLSVGETVTIDLTPGNKTIKSNYTGDIPVMPGGDLMTWSLLPGHNDVRVFATPASGLPTVAAEITWVNRYWGAD